MTQRSHARTSIPHIEEPTLIDVEPGAFRFYKWKNLLLVMWLGESGVSAIQRLGQAVVALQQEHPAGTSAVHFLNTNVKLPDAETRSALVQLSDQHAERLGAVAVVLAGSGFWASTMRSVVTAMRVLTARAYEMRIHGQLEEVADWLPAEHAKRTGVTIDREALLHVLKLVERA